MRNRRIFAHALLAVALSALLAVSCRKNDSDATLTFEVPSVYFTAAGSQAVVSFTAKGLSRFYVSSKPTGWGDDNVMLDAARKQLTIVMPAATDDGTVVESGTITLAGYTSKNNVKSATLFVGIVPEQELQGPANCFIATEPDRHYVFKPVRRDGTELHPDHVDVVWQTSSRLLQYLHLDANNRVSFYIGADGAYTDEILRGNAVIGAYDAKNNLLWSWHIWSSSYDPEADVVEWQNGYAMMNRNLGAYDNANTTAAERLASYGLYYQWGRKDPFIGPSDYRFSNGTSASMYATSYASVKIAYEESTAETGTAAYAAAHPLTFLTATSASNYDWNWSTASGGGWVSDYDPCPYGWKVAPANAFSGLLLEGDPTADDYDIYGWPMTDGSATSLFLAGGYRTYLNGYFQNVYEPAVGGRANSALEAQPWVGYYWTADTGIGRNAVSYYFWYDKKNVTGGRALIDAYQANGCSVRCVKE